jgi:hypothetical protein
MTDYYSRHLCSKLMSFPDEFRVPILKVLYCALLTPDKFALTEKEIETLHNFQVDFSLSALNYAE